ncbi:phenylacetate-CoA oxygenase subunit PaaJ [Bordetella sp. J329]|jgi:ring-1,2-phenylacetyl-CoA epoxidase subunit PaaD|uniref:1,2-phenylacetyl-CoA epoxidase subunit PaaD n=1 Tax=Kerstersia gyiorum TaxID=206506 RepID=UPI000FD979B2|nr:1,2-phenylacetyl-CoA epoxidase subunit PaaD [Kerstersia gyiorum]AZV92903.1 phenylacetate-CoA oxygenase subunit PaaJ [Bordetella sp. J329]MCH4271019.1 phenylacetate-CoA oxygenase subunit PaaJ [Kerstersia gyiorum]MCI1230010.1 phenylacetate-CoA oxygenase subunit PaaJ [Kerstersia gyiorum]
MDILSRPEIEQVWQWLEGVPDPEIPVISLVDLGIIRDVRYEGETLVVVVTPTYSGCPATTVINEDIEAALRAHGVTDLRLERQLSPPWTSDWMSDKARESLRGYGIAPPVEEAGDAAAAGAGKRIWLRQENGPSVTCPHCGSKHTARVSQFGSTPCKASYRCLDCLEPFDYFKCI